MEKEEFEWGTRLTARPLSRCPLLVIHADIRRNSPAVKRDIQVTFTAPTDMLRPSEARTWVSAMAAILAEADTVADSYVPKKKK